MQRAPTPNPVPERHKPRTVQRLIRRRSLLAYTGEQASGLCTHANWMSHGPWMSGLSKQTTAKTTKISLDRRAAYYSHVQMSISRPWRRPSASGRPVVQQFPRNNDHKRRQINHTIGGNFSDKSAVNVTRISLGWCRKKTYITFTTESSVRPKYPTSLDRYIVHAEPIPHRTRPMLLIYTNGKLHNKTNAYVVLAFCSNLSLYITYLLTYLLTAIAWERGTTNATRGIASPADTEPDAAGETYSPPRTLSWYGTYF